LPRGRVMTPKRKAVVGFAATVLFLVASGLAAFWRTVSRRPAAAAAELVPASWSEFRASTGHEQHVGKGSVARKASHRYQSNGFRNPGGGVCTRCHANETTHTHAGGQTKTDCLACHPFAPRAAPTCITCHAEAQGTHAAVAQHASVACNECHHPHATPSVA